MPRQLLISKCTAQAFPRLETEPDEALIIGDTLKYGQELEDELKNVMPCTSLLRRQRRHVKGLI